MLTFVRQRRLTSLAQNACMAHGATVSQSTMKKIDTKHLLEDLPLTSMDMARLVLEMMEEMPALHEVAAIGRAPLMQALRRVMREGIAAVKAQEKTVTFAQAATESLERRSRAGRRPTTLRDLRHFIRRLLRAPGLATKPLRSLQMDECQKALEQTFARSAHSFRKGRAIMHSIFAYGMRQGWCSSNPVTAIEAPRVEEKEIEPLSVATCQRLIESARAPRFRACLPALGLMLFAGVRPGEVSRLRWSDIHCEEGILSIAARHSKTGGARRVELCPSLLRMLRAQRPTAPQECHQHLCPPRWKQCWQGLRRQAGFSHRAMRWIPDVLRHTFASYHALTYHNLPALQLQLGHRDARLLLTRYLNITSLRRQDLPLFWKLLE